MSWLKMFSYACVGVVVSVCYRYSLFPVQTQKSHQVLVSSFLVDLGGKKQDKTTKVSFQPDKGSCFKPMIVE